MALGPSSWPLIDLIMNTPNMGRSDVGKPPKAELGQVRSSRGFVLTSPQGAVRSVQCMVALGLTGFVSQTHAWLLRGHPLLAGILPRGAPRTAVKSPVPLLPARHAGSHSVDGFEVS